MGFQTFIFKLDSVLDCHLCDKNLYINVPYLIAQINLGWHHIRWFCGSERLRTSVSVCSVLLALALLESKQNLIHRFRNIWKYLFENIWNKIFLILINKIFENNRTSPIEIYQRRRSVSLDIRTTKSPLKVWGNIIIFNCLQSVHIGGKLN